VIVYSLFFLLNQQTALIRGLSKRLQWPILMITPSVILHPYVGQSSQIIRAIFSLAQKLQHCIIMVDEMDAIFSSRNSASLTSQERFDRQIMMEFLQHWDELARRSDCIMVVGLTNRPQDLDSAVRRRFEKHFKLDFPVEDDREKIFQCVLRNVQKENLFDYRKCAQQTAGFTSSDILDLCKAAVSRVERRKRWLKRKYSEDNLSSNNVEVTPTAANNFTSSVNCDFLTTKV
jgi:ATPase family AAA domain-containing protein 1